MSTQEKVNQLPVLNDISTALSSSLNLKETMESIFDILHSHMAITRGILCIVDKNTHELHIESSYGLDDTQIKHELQVVNIIRKEVLESCKTIVVPNLSDEKNIFSKIGPRENVDNISYICIPLFLGDEKLGTLGVDLPFKSNDSLESHVETLSLLGLMISQEVKLKSLLETERIALVSENKKLKDELLNKYNIHNMVGKSRAMTHVFESIGQVANSNATVLIRGESGTGKELVASALHYNSDRAEKPFIRINCGAIPESLIESELFGYEKGAFTGAEGQKIGKFEAANSGTIFLDEIGELSTNIQVKLLRVLQEKEFDRVGGTTPVKIDVRVITATNRDLEKEVQENRFRQDLYYRLNVFPIFIPPLRDRKSDILLLTDHFLQKYTKENNKEIKRLSSLAIDLLSQYHWPGNVRELENCIERAVLLCQSDTIQASNLPPTLQTTDLIAANNENLSLKDLVQNYEKEIIIEALKKAKGNKTKAATTLQTTPRIIGYKIEQLAIDLTQF